MQQVDSYPSECTVGVVLADGSLARIRAIRPDDAAELQAFHDTLSQETVYRRFFGTHPHLRPEEVERFTHVDYRDRLALVAEAGDRLVAVARYDRPPGSNRAEVAFVVADELQGHGVGTLLLEHLAAAARRRGVAEFSAETLGTNHQMQAVFHRAGFPATQRISTGIAQVRFPIAPTDAYLEAVLQRDAFALHARLEPVGSRPGAAAIGLVCESEAGAAAVASSCRHLGIELSSVVVAESLGVDVADAIACLAADQGSRVVLLHAELIGPPARAVAHARSLTRRKPILAFAPRAWSANLCTQAGVELVDSVASLAPKGAERLATVVGGTWQPPARGALVDLGGCDIGAARSLIDAAASARDPDPCPLEPATSAGLMAAYSIDWPRGEGPTDTPSRRLMINGDGARAFWTLGRVTRMLPLTNVDAGELAGTDDRRATEVVLRLARMVDDQPDICRIEARVAPGGAASQVRVWTAPPRDRPDDPFVRRIPPGPEERMEAP